MIRLFEYRVYRTQEEPVPFCWKVLLVLFMLGTLLAMTAVCSSCQPEEDVEAIGAEEDLPATIRLEVQGEEQVILLPGQSMRVWSAIFIFWCITVRVN